jgi:hypothetical protein
MRKNLCIAFSLISILVISWCAQTLLAAPISHIGTNQGVLVICVKYSDVPTTRMANCSDWVNVLQTQINPFVDQATFGATTFQFTTPGGGPTDGWHDLGFDRASYDFDRIAARAIDSVDPNVDFAQVNRILIITNNQDFGAQGDQGFGYWYPVDEGVEATFMEGGVAVGKRQMTALIANEWTADAGWGVPQDNGATAMGHELGHNLDVKTHYADIHWFPGITRDIITPWDIMGLSPGLNHYLGWAKAERTWVPAGSVTTVGPPMGGDINQTITLKPLESATAGIQVIRIPIVAAPFYGYVVENRRRINGDEQIPSEGVLLTLVDENTSTILKTIVLDDPGSPGDSNLAPLETGDSYTDASHNITITYQSLMGNDAEVRIRYQLPPAMRPNPSITPWGAPPWETPDIWIDSQRNGLDAYRYTDAAGNPAGNGDDAWVDHDNRLYVRITNSGPGPAANVRVEVYANSPPGMGDRGADWAYLGTIIFPAIASMASAQDFVIWKPTVGEHTCVKAVILNSPVELATTDNLAQENVTAFDTSSGSDYKSVGLKIRVNNPFEKEKTPVRFYLRDLPRGWGAWIEPREMTLAPGGYAYVSFRVFPSGLKSDCKKFEWDPKLQEVYRPGYLAKPKLEARVPYADTFIPIGGVEVWTHLVKPTQLTCDTGQTRAAQRETSQPPGTPGLRDKQPRKANPMKLEDLRKIVEDGQLIHPELPPAYARSGEAITVTGRLSPEIPGSVIAVEMTGETGKRFLEITKTEKDGTYRAVFKIPGSGLWQIKGYYDGDQQYGKSESNACRVIVR